MLIRLHRPPSGIKFVSRVTCHAPRVNRRGFTFIELLIVFSIIAILAAILFPVFAKAQEKGRQANCGANLHNIGAALRMYAVEHYGHFPPTSNDFAPLLMKHLPEPASLICPSLYGPKAAIQYPPPLPEQLAASRTRAGYVYRAGLMDDDVPSSIVAADLFGDLHNGGANYLWVDGHGKWLSGNQQRSPGQETLWREIEGINALRVAAGGKASLVPRQPPPPHPGGDYE